MKFTLSWLKTFLDTQADIKTIVETLTNIGLEVEEIINPAETLSDFVVAKIETATRHPDADKLQVCHVNNGKEILQIVCGAPNARAGLYVALAPVGTHIPAGDFTIRKSKIRGVESCGMLCSASELGLGDDSDGIIEVAADDQYLGKPYVQVAGLDDPVIDIAITPNRGDCLGVYGIARDLAAAGLGTLILPVIPALKGQKKSPINVKIEAKAACTQFKGCYVSDVNNMASPDFITRRLKAIGMNPKSALVDISNYMMISYGRPMHAYDADTLTGDLVARFAKDGETITALNDQTYTLTSNMLVIGDGASAQAIAGIIGGRASGCSDKTTNIMLELAVFDPLMVANTGRKLEVLTDSRYRFERGVDPLSSNDILALTIDMIITYCGGVAHVPVCAETATHTPVFVTCSARDVAALTGVTLSDKACEVYLTLLGFEKGKKGWKVPSWRHDIHGKADLVEEIIRLAGYDNINAIPLDPMPDHGIFARPDQQQRLYTGKMALIERGYCEVVTWSFTHHKKLALFSQHPSVTLINPISSELDTMRQTILPNLLDVVKKNTDRGYPNLVLCEAGRVYQGVSLDQQLLNIAGIRSGEAVSRNVHGQARPVDIFDVKADLLASLEAMEIPTANLTTDTSAPDYYHPGRRGALKLGKAVLGYFGQVHPVILKEWDIKSPVVAFEINLEQFPPKKKKLSAKKPLDVSDYQSSTRDFAFLIADKISAEQMTKAVRNADKVLIEDVQLFDVFTGKHVPDGQKSIALSVTLRAKDHTLTEQEIEQVSVHIVKSVEKLGGNLR